MVICEPLKMHHSSLPMSESQGADAVSSTTVKTGPAVWAVLKGSENQFSTVSGIEAVTL